MIREVLVAKFQQPVCASLVTACLTLWKGHVGENVSVLQNSVMQITVI